MFKKVFSRKRKKVVRAALVRKRGRSIDWELFFIVIGLCLFGLLMVYEASSASALRDFGDKFHYLKDQVKWFGIGLVFLTFFSFLDYHILYPASLFMLVGQIVLLVAVFIPGLGIETFGARRWLNLGLFSFQPAELAKLTLVIYFASWFSSKEKRRFLAFMMLFCLVVGLILLEPDMGTAMVISFLSLVLYFFSGARFVNFFFLIPTGILAVLGMIMVAPYRVARLATFLNIKRDILGSSYHINQILIALGSGGLFGLGLGQSRQKFEYLPEAMTDSIFAIVGEELGFLGAAVLILALFYLVYKGYQIAIAAPDNLGKLLALGVVFYLGIQTVINLSAMVSLIPLTGVPLPFISYGGSALIVEMSAIGIILNISRSVRK